METMLIAYYWWCDFSMYFIYQFGTTHFLEPTNICFLLFSC